MLLRGSGVVTLCVVLLGCGNVGPLTPREAPTPHAAVAEWRSLPRAPLTARREAAGAVLDGRFYVVGGQADTPCPPNASCAAATEPPLRDGASFDPASGAWRSIAVAPTPVGGALQTVVIRHTLVVLTDEVGRLDSPVSLLSYDPAADAWTTLPLPPTRGPRLVVADEQLVAVGDSDEQTPARDFVLDFDRLRWEQLPDDPIGPSYGRQAAWLGDRLLLTAADLVDNPGGDGHPSLTRLATLDKTLKRWTLLPDSELIGADPVWVAERVVFPGTGSADGGKVGNWGRDYYYGAIFDPATATWTPLPNPPNTRSGLEGFVRNVDDRTLVGGHLLQPATLAWTEIPLAPWGEVHRGSQTIATGPGAVFVWGGDNGERNLADGFLLTV